MRVLPLGGASEVGASSSILDVDGARILIDAGVRTSSAGRKQPLPMFDLIGDKTPDSVMVTHAHSDHTGALPLILGKIGDAPIHMNTGTLHLLEVLQLDAVRHMADMDELEGVFNGTVYREEDVERLISRVVNHGYENRFFPVPGREDIQVTSIPCGHILGAEMLIIDTPEGRGLWTGDYSVLPQPTIPGVSLERLRQFAEERPFDFMVTEGTYGAAVHPPREQEQERLIRVLERATQKGGKVLIPAFGVGRSQDITALIREAKIQGRLGGVSVYLDGMVRGVTSIYQSLAHDLFPERIQPLQLLDPELGIYRVNGQSRTKLLSGDISEPAIVIASSGMLVGGRSVEYAKAFASGRNNAILITGYQDEESPGKSLVNLKKGGLLNLGDHGKVRVRCFVGTYQLSAHADFAQIKSVVEAVNPRRLGVVHGDRNALSSFAKAMKEFRNGNVDILQNGKEYKIASSRRRWYPVARSGEEVKDIEAGGAPISLEGPQVAVEIRNLWSGLVDKGDKIYSEHEICRLLLGHAYEPDQREKVASLLADHRLFFLSGSATGQRCYRPRSKQEVCELLIERSNAYQIPLIRGDVVTYCDGSTDIFTALLDEIPVKGGEVSAVVAQSSRRVVNREWIRCVTGINAEKMLTGHRGHCARWLENLIRDARAIPNLNPIDVYFHSLGHSPQGIHLNEALSVFFPDESNDFSETMRLAGAIVLSGATSLFSLGSDGTFCPRPKEEVALRWSAFPAVEYIYSLPDGSKVSLSTGQNVILTGVKSIQSFEAKTEEGVPIRCNYRRVSVIPSQLKVVTP